jgi:hypothetical protein
MTKNISVRPCLTVHFWRGRNNFMEATAVRLYVNIKKEKTILV